ncbi:MAG: leucine-rich repeat protein, partial [Bacteroidota bacterium]|nr:leucine-rich repeat protein [Bacteroidota bacterium]
MKRVILLNICLLMTMMLHSTVEKTVDVSAGGSLSLVLSETELSTITNLTIRGTIDARDFKTIRDNMDHLNSLDISAVMIEGYSGTSGTNEAGLITYPANTIPEYAFYNSNRNNGKIGLSTITLPSSVTAIGDFSFCGCRGLTSITIPSSVLSIGNSAFQYCSKLASLTFRPVSNISIIGDYAFDSCCGLTGVLSIPSSVASIGVAAFQYCSNLTSLTFEMPSRINAIENSAFESCSGLTGALTIPASVKTIGKYAFYGCSHFTLVANSSLGASLGGGVSFKCNNLISLDSYPTHPTNITSSANVYRNVDNSFLKASSSAISTPAEQSGDLLYLEESPYFTLSFSRTTVAASSNSIAVVDVKSNITWTAVSDKPWLTVSQGATGNGTLTLTASANPSIITRAATVTVSGPGVTSQTIKVTQAGLIQVAISSPSVTLSKVYDGNNSVVVSPGVLSGVAEADGTDIGLVATGTYDNAKVGTGKTITVKY